MKTNIGNSQTLYDIPMYSTNTGIDTIDDIFVIVKITRRTTGARGYKFGLFQSTF